MLLKYLKEYTIMTLGLAVFVCGWVAFLNPHEITGGGIAGLASVIHYGINSIPVSYAKFAIDILLLVAGFIILGKGFGIKTIYCVAMSFVFFQFMPMIPGLTSISAGITDNLINARAVSASPSSSPRAAAPAAPTSLHFQSTNTRTSLRDVSIWYATPSL